MFRKSRRARFETGRDRDDIEGWITVRADAPSGDETWCGWAFVGRQSNRPLT